MELTPPKKKGEADRVNRTSGFILKWPHNFYINRPQTGFL